MQGQSFQIPNFSNQQSLFRFMYAEHEEHFCYFVAILGGGEWLGSPGSRSLWPRVSHFEGGGQSTIEFVPLLVT